MSSFPFVAILLTTASGFGFLNYRFLRLPSAIGLLVVSLIVSIGVIAIDPLLGQHSIRRWSQALLNAQDLPRALLGWALAFLLFAGALHVDFEHLRKRKALVIILATVGVLIATVLMACC